jgi:pimeloyl-ACP methyl ester carboxylesterase
VHHAGELSLEPYPFQTFDGATHPAELGRLWVRENRDGPSDRLIQIAFVRLPSTAAKPRSPVVFLSGGPGVPGIVIGRVPAYHRLFEKLQTLSDVILLDQRGVGMSSPNTACPEGTPPPPAAFETEAGFREALMALARACTDHWRGEGLDVAAFTTAASADDVEDLRVALAADKVSLIAHSYGTAVALAAIRRHDAHLDRVALAGTEGPDQTVQLPMVSDFALRRLSVMAAAAPGLSGVFPDTYREFQQVLEKAGKEPLSVPIQTSSKQRSTVRVGAFVLRLTVKNMLFTGRQADRVPALVYSLAQGDSTLLIPAVQSLYNALTSGFSAMQFSVSCSDGWSPERRALAEEQASRSVFGDAPFVHLDPDLCGAAGSASPQSESLLPVWSAVPTLLVSGTLDSNTPAFQSDEIVWGLSNGASVRVENGFHETLPSPAVQAIIMEFLGGADVADRSVAIPPPTFLTIEEAHGDARTTHGISFPHAVAVRKGSR